MHSLILLRKIKYGNSFNSTRETKMYPFGERFFKESQGISKKELVVVEGTMVTWGVNNHNHGIFTFMIAMQMKTDHNYSWTLEFRNTVF